MKEIDQILFELHRLFAEVKVGEFKPELHEQIQESIARVKPLIRQVDDVVELDRISIIMNSIVTMALDQLDRMERNIRELKRQLQAYSNDLRQQGVPPRFLKSPEKLLESLGFLNANIREKKGGKPD